MIDLVVVVMEQQTASHRQTSLAQLEALAEPGDNPIRWPCML